MAANASAATALPAALTKSKLYRTGTVTPTSCSIPRVRRGSTASVKAFHQAMASCADRFWAARLHTAGLRYVPPKLEVTTRKRSACGQEIVNGAHYCSPPAIVAIRIMKYDLRSGITMNLAHPVAHEWGHHVQQLTGIWDAHNTLYERSGKKQRLMLTRRLEMQAECLAGVFYRANLDAIGPDTTWAGWIKTVREGPASKAHGKPRNLAYWQDRGYTAGSAAACNTWTAPNALVA